MCTVSMVMDHYDDEWRRRLYGPGRLAPPSIQEPFITRPITQDEVDEFRRLLDRAREYDKRNGEPDCELDSKKQRLLELAKELGVEINFL